MRLLILSLACLSTMAFIGGKGVAQTPPHSPALWYSGDFFSGHPTGTLIPEFFVWSDNISGVPASLYGVGDVEIRNGELNSHTVVRDNTVAAPYTPGPGHAHWRIHDSDMPGGLLVGTNDYTLIAVARSADPITDINNVGIAAVWGPASHQWYLSAEPGGGFQRTFHSVGGTNGSTFQSLGSVGLTNADLTGGFQAYGWVKSGGASPLLQYHTNGETTAVNGTTIANLGPNDEMSYGRRLQFMNSNGAFNGDVAEFIVYDYALNALQLADLDAYLDVKFFSTTPAEDADFDNNNLVNGNDHLIFQRGFGTDAGTGNVAPPLDGNANGDQFINGTDQAIWANQYGGPPPLSAIASVPEPSSLVLSLLTACLLAGRPRLNR